MLESEQTLSRDQLTQWGEGGYLVVERAISMDIVGRMREATERLTAERESAGGMERLVSLHSAPLREPVFWEAVRHPALVATVTQLLGPDVIIHDVKLNWKPPARGRGELGWHQDFPYFPRTNFNTLAVLVFLDDSTVANGCVKVIPGSHKRGPVDHFRNGDFTGTATNPADYADEDSAVNLEVPAGTLTFHHGCMLHASGPNTSDHSRRALAVDLARADAVLLGGNSHELCGTVLVGEDALVARLEGGHEFKLPRPVTPQRIES